MRPYFISSAVFTQHHREFETECPTYNLVMKWPFGIVVALLAIATQVAADTPVSSEQHPLFDGPLSSDSWTITTTSGFSDDSAVYSQGLIEAGSLNMSHSRPMSTSVFTSYATQSVTGSTFATGLPNGDYSWSKGPDIIVSDFDFQGLHDMDILRVSLEVHLEIPDAMPSDEVMIVFQTESEIQLVTTIARTTSPIMRFSTPLAYTLGNSSNLNWSIIESSSVKVDYVSDGAPDDSEVRVDAVGITVTYFQPWYGFENVKAESRLSDLDYPALDFDGTKGETSGLVLSSCGLEPSSSSSGQWDIFGIRPPFEQSLGRVHIYGGEGLDASLYLRVDGGSWVTWSDGPLLPDVSVLDVSLVIRQGCVNSIRVDVNDPTLTISGEIEGDFVGLVENLSQLRFAIGTNLVLEHSITNGSFNLEVPIGRYLPADGEDLEIRIGARFQWSSDGTPESTYLEINQIRLSGGFTVDIDESPHCQNPANLQLVEDEGGITIPVLSACNDDRDDVTELDVTATTRSVGILALNIANSDLQITPFADASGRETVDLVIKDSAGNSWSGSFVVDVEEISDPPSVIGAPSTITIELGESSSMPIQIYDPDSDQLSITTSRSWASVQDGVLVMEPLLAGPTQLIITVGDGLHFTEVEIEVIVRAMPELSISSVSSVGYDLERNLEPGVLIDLTIIIENRGQGPAFDAGMSCSANGVLYATTKIPLIPAQSPIEAYCTVPAPVEEGLFTIAIELDSKEQLVSENSQMTFETTSNVKEPNDESILELSESSIIFSLLTAFIILVSIALFFGPNSIRKPFE